MITMTPCRRGLAPGLSLLRVLAFVIAAYAATTQVARAQAGPPMLTDDPGTADKGTLEWNTAAAVQKERNGASETLLPVIDIAYGVTDHMEIGYESHWIIAKDPGSPSKSGWDDSTLSLKRRFADEEKQGLDMSVEPQFTFNSGSSAYSRGILEKNSDLLIPFEMGKTVGPVVLNAEVGRDFHSREASRDDYWFAGVSVGHEFTPQFEGVVELYDPNSSRTFRDNSLILNFGVRYKISKTCLILVSSGPGIGGALRPKFVGYYGLQLIF